MQWGVTFCHRVTSSQTLSPLKPLWDIHILQLVASVLETVIFF